MGDDEDQAAATIYAAALERAAREAEHHPAPVTPGLRTTERDPATIVLHEDLQQHQLTWDYLLKMPEDKLYWLAAHQERPRDSRMTEDGWHKLRQNAWRARAAAERRERDAAAAAQAAEHKRNRTTTFRTAIMTAVIAFAASMLAVWLTRPGPPDPVEVRVQRFPSIEVVNPGGPTTSAPSATTTTTP